MSIDVDLVRAGNTPVQVFHPGAYFPDYDEPQAGYTVLVGIWGDNAVGFTGTLDELDATIQRLIKVREYLKNGLTPADPVTEEAIDAYGDYAVDIDGYGRGPAFIKQF